MRSSSVAAAQEYVERQRSPAIEKRGIQLVQPQRCPDPRNPIEDRHRRGNIPVANRRIEPTHASGRRRGVDRHIVAAPHKRIGRKPIMSLTTRRKYDPQALALTHLEGIIGAEVG